MAGSLLFDIASIDLSGVAVSHEEVGRLNPQCGDMRQLDHVIWLSPDVSCAMAVKHVRHDEFWVPYHIPGRPLFPGVLMIEAAAQLCSLQYKLRRNDRSSFLGFTRCDNVVFRNQVVPGDTFHIISRELGFGARRVVSETQGLVNGKLVFEAKITGMTL